MIRPSRSGNDRGSIAIETAILLPLIAMLIALAVVTGRTAVTQSALDNAAFDGARTASLARNAVSGQNAARSQVQASLRRQALTCTSLSIEVDTSQFAYPLGTPADVTVTLTCVLSFGPFHSLPGVPLQRTLTAAFTSPIDQYRGRT